MLVVLVVVQLRAPGEEGVPRHREVPSPGKVVIPPWLPPSAPAAAAADGDYVLVESPAVAGPTTLSVPATPSSRIYYCWCRSSTTAGGDAAVLGSCSRSGGGGGAATPHYCWWWCSCARQQRHHKVRCSRAGHFLTSL